MVDIGKHAKQMGREHPRDTRKLDPMPERSTPRAKPHRRAAKLFGYAYEFNGFRFTSGRLWREWKLRVKWFDSRESRDQSLRTLRARCDGKLYRNAEAVERSLEIGGS